MKFVKTGLYQEVGRLTFGATESWKLGKDNNY